MIQKKIYIKHRKSKIKSKSKNKKYMNKLFKYIKMYKKNITSFWKKLIIKKSKNIKIRTYTENENQRFLNE